MSCHSCPLVRHQSLTPAREVQRSRGPAALTEVEVFANDSPLTERVLSLHPLSPPRPPHPPHSLTALTPGWLEGSSKSTPCACLGETSGQTLPPLRCPPFVSAWSQYHRPSTTDRITAAWPSCHRCAAEGSQRRDPGPCGPENSGDSDIQAEEISGLKRAATPYRVSSRRKSERCFALSSCNSALLQ